MASIHQDIQTVRSLRKDIRDPKLSPSTLKAIESIHQCMMTGSDQNGWKKVEWRGSVRPQQGQHQKNHYQHRSAKPIDHTSSYSFQNRSRNATATTAAAAATAATAHNENTVHTHEAEAPRRTFQESADGFRTSTQKYISKFKKTAGKVEDTILNTILLGKLNKFSEPNYNEIKEFITHIIDSGQTDMIKCFMSIVFEKAASEEIFCPLYARLLSELSTQYPVLLTEMENLFSEYMKIFEEIVDSSSETYNELCKRNVEKKYRRGYSQFLTELIKHNCIDTATFMKTITTIITQIELNLCMVESIKLNEEFADCLMKIMKAIKTNLPQEDDENHIYQIRTILKHDMIDRIQPLTLRHPDYTGVSNKARFTFLDIYESIQKF
jgi:hypothetical protein|uniref:MIF4G domain-containing protein n=1 Tax=viral metagenome TaxID=1070528 RepID=A0A6C0BFV3_9ZZZZ